MSKLRIDLVFEGGGVLGFSFVGSYKAFIDRGFEVVRCAGTSAGSIISSLIIAGYTVDELLEILETTKFKQFYNKTKLSRFFLVGKPLSLFFNKGFYNSICIEKWIDKLLAKKGIKTFRDIMINDESPLKIIVADITMRKMLVIPDDLKLYDINPSDFSVARAVRMSCTIPFFYTPVKLQNGKLTSYCVDGGLLSTFPIWVFDIDKKPLRPVYGLKIKDKESNTSSGKKNIFAYTQDIINACINKDEMYFVRTKSLVKMILIDNNQQVKSTNFKLSKNDIDNLYNLGYQAVENYFSVKK